ncbi:hypothetical protein NCS57_00482300 [Fusarium keratoplasticum]|uniref:Uncharacterized protein n=1 Tax=Fusarium keratoplasticum TaxID=1328300 RepID=A0ACC0R7Y7_9HYPO|nr:hypothetical protein NCS57_00482300 [Fusarium keratoplasticum]KAI8675799.1 hypothetical protein NCS57_00482300 [Fusarium keratoplasticum]
MEDMARLLRETRGAQNYDIELQERPQAPPVTRPASRPRSTKKSKRVWIPMLLFYLLGVHLLFFQFYLDGKPAKKTISQSLQAAMANIFALFVDICLLGSLGIAYNQILWRLLRKKPFQAQVIDKLVHLPGSPWDLVHFKILRRSTHLKRVWVTTLLCAMIPFALIFPPGCVETKFLNKLETTLHDVKTMNISDYGNGTVHQFIEHSLFEMLGDVNYIPMLARPKLKAIATQVLASGEPVKFDSPCGASCVYNISLEGPSFHCEESKQKPTLCDSIYEAKDMIKFEGHGDLYSISNNAFQITWDPKPKPMPSNCDIESRKSLICRMKLSTYTLEIEHSSDASRSIKAQVDNHRDVWTEQDGIQASFYYYFFNATTGFLDPALADELDTNFTKSQAFAIRQAAIHSLLGKVQLSIATDILSIHGNALQVVGSPYIGLDDKFNARFNISAENIERFLRDVVISTISIGASTHNGDIEALVGTEVYVFGEKLQFYIPYWMCFFVTFVINLYGVWCWRQNGSSAGNSFLQFATTTGSSKTLNKLAALCPGGDDHIPKELKEIELQFVDGRFRTRSQGSNCQ